MSESNEQFGEIREFLHTHSPDSEDRKALLNKLYYIHLADPDFYRAECLPYLEGFASWYAEPLDWCTLPIWNSANYYRAPVMFYQKYRELMPFGPLALAVCTLSWQRINSYKGLDLFCQVTDSREEEYAWKQMPDDETLKAELKRCVWLGCDEPITYSESTSQEFSEMKLCVEELSRPLRELYRRMPALRRIELCAELDKYCRRVKRDKISSLRRALFQATAKRKKLEHLTLSCGLTVKDVWRHVGGNWPQLVSLDLSSNKWGQSRNYSSEPDRSLTDMFPAQMPLLQSLSFRACAGVHDDALLELFEEATFPELRELDLRATGVTPELHEKLLESKALPLLERVIMPAVSS